MGTYAFVFIETKKKNESWKFFKWLTPFHKEKKYSYNEETRNWLEQETIPDAIINDEPYSLQDSLVYQGCVRDLLTGYEMTRGSFGKQGLPSDISEDCKKRIEELGEYSWGHVHFYLSDVAKYFDNYMTHLKNSWKESIYAQSDEFPLNKKINAILNHLNIVIEQKEYYDYEEEIIEEIKYNLNLYGFIHHVRELVDSYWEYEDVRLISVAG